MQNKGILFALLVMIVLMGAVVNAQNITVNIDPAPDPSGFFVVGDTVRISGDNIISEITNITLISQPGFKLQYFNALVNGGRWEYSFTSLNHGAYNIVVGTGDVDVVRTGFSIGSSLPKTPTTPPTPLPTPDYDAKIRALETKLIEQDAKVDAQETKIKQIDEKTPIPTTVPTTIITTKTPVPTQTVDYEATLASMQRQIDQQNDIIYQILHFLGLR